MIPEYARILSDENEPLFRAKVGKAPLCIENVAQATHLDHVNVLPFQHPLESLWQLPEDEVCNDISITSKKDFNPDDLKLVFLEHIQEKYPNFVQIYTDGSKLKNGVCFAYFHASAERGIKLDNIASIFNAKLYVILNVLQSIEHTHYINFTILTDSKNLIQAINKVNNEHPIVTKIQ